MATKHIHFAHFTRVWGNPPIHTLTVDVLDRDREHRRGEDVGAATINREMAPLKHALSKAVEWKLLRKTAREELAAIKKYQEPSGRLRYLSGPADADRLLAACEESLKPIVLTALHTGMRKEELLSLTWDAVDMTHGFIRLKQTKNGTARALSRSMKHCGACSAGSERAKTSRGSFTMLRGDATTISDTPLSGPVRAQV